LIYVSKLEGHFPFCVAKRKVREKVFHLRQGYGGQGEKGDGVPSNPYGLRRDKLRKKERTDPVKGFSLFRKSNCQPLSGTKHLSNLKSM